MAVITHKPKKWSIPDPRFCATCIADGGRHHGGRGRHHDLRLPQGPVDFAPSQLYSTCKKMVNSRFQLDATYVATHVAAGRIRELTVFLHYGGTCVVFSYLGLNNLFNCICDQLTFGSVVCSSIEIVGIVYCSNAMF